RALREAESQGGRKTRLPKRQTTLAGKKLEEEKSAEAATQDDARAREIAELQRIEEEERKKGEAAGEPRPYTHRRRDGSDEEAGESDRDRLKKAAEKAPPHPRDEYRHTRRLTVTQALNEDFDRDRGPSLAAQRRAREKARMAAQLAAEPPKKVVREVILPETITVQELS